MRDRKFNTQRSNFDLDIERTDNTDFEEVVICSKCKGQGSYGSDGTFMVYGADIKNQKAEDTCNYCDGTGKLVKQTKVKFKAFDYKLALKTQILRNPENLI